MSHRYVNVIWTLTAWCVLDKETKEREATFFHRLETRGEISPAYPGRRDTSPSRFMTSRLLLQCEWNSLTPTRRVHARRLGRAREWHAQRLDPMIWFRFIRWLTVCTPSSRRCNTECKCIRAYKFIRKIWRKIIFVTFRSCMYENRIIYFFFLTLWTYRAFHIKQNLRD